MIPFEVSHYDDVERAWILRRGGEEVVIRGTLKDDMTAASKEWIAITELWYKEREDCGCATCLEEVSNG